MDLDILQKFKAQLEKQWQTLRGQIKKLRSSPPQFGDDIDSGEEETDEAQAMSNQISTAQVFKDRAADVELALSKIKKKKYGICELCGKEISPKILETAPESRFCQSCKKKKMK